MPIPTIFEIGPPGRLLTPEFIECPSLHDIAVIAISSAEMGGEYKVLLGERSRSDPDNPRSHLQAVINSESNNVDIGYHPNATPAANQLLVGVLALEMGLRGADCLTEWFPIDQKDIRNYPIYPVVFGKDLFAEKSSSGGIRVEVNLQSPQVVGRLKTFVAGAVDAYRP